MNSCTSYRRGASIEETGRIYISASLLGADHSRLREAALEAARAGVEYLHIDVMDGHFVPNLAFGPGVVAGLRDVGIPLMVHLMVTGPERHVEAFIRAGAASVTVHSEACSDARGTLATIRSLGARAGLALSPGTPLDAAAALLAELDLLLLMTVNPGYSGQSFMPEVLPKIRAAAAALRGANPAAMIEVDGGIGPETGYLAAQAGATILAAGSSLFARGDMASAVAALRAAAARGSGQRARAGL